MLINDEVSKDIFGNKDVISMNVYRFNNVELDLEEEIDEDKLIQIIAEAVKSRYKFVKVNNIDNTKANVFLLETRVSDLNRFTILDPQDLSPFEMVTMQMSIAEVMEEEGFSRQEIQELESTEMPEKSEDIEIVNESITINTLNVEPVKIDIVIDFPNEENVN